MKTAQFENARSLGSGQEGRKLGESKPSRLSALMSAYSMSSTKILRRKEAAKERKAAIKRVRAPIGILVASRIAIISLQAVSNWAIPDHEADAFPSLPVRPASVLDHLVERLFRGFARWDSLHFLHIAQYGYTFENNLAFFPLFPVLVRVLTSVVFPLLPQVQPFYALLLTATALNFAAFIAAGYFLHQVTLNYFKDEQKARISLLIFAFNPASIFFSAAYSESLFFLFTLVGLDVLSGGEGRSWVSQALMGATVFGLAWLTRANGLLNSIFLAWPIAGPLLPLVMEFSSRWMEMMGIVLLAFLTMILFGVPYAYHQWAIFRDFCSNNKPYVSKAIEMLGRERNLVMAGELSRLPWCHRTLPFSYAYIQAQYWDVGFLQYFQLRKLPLFILAAPTLVLSAYGSLFANVEVSTRLVFSSNPLIYWLMADLLGSADTKSVPAFLSHSLRRGSVPALIVVYMFTYATIGTALHANFLPWT